MLVAGFWSTRLSHRGTFRLVSLASYMSCLPSERFRVSLSEMIFRRRLEEASERILGDLPVLAHLSMGYERLTLFFTDRRIIVGRRGKSGAGAVPATFILGSLGNVLGGLFRGGRRGSSKSQAQYPSPGAALAAHRDNFSIPFSEVVSVALTQTLSTNDITILSKNDKYHFSSPTRFSEIQQLFTAGLKDKMTVSRTEEE